MISEGDTTSTLSTFQLNNRLFADSLTWVEGSELQICSFCFNRRNSKQFSLTRVLNGKLQDARRTAVFCCILVHDLFVKNAA